jgi:hypothetical protein
MRPADSPLIAQQRAAARRTALVIGAIALAVYVAFVLSGVVGR